MTRLSLGLLPSPSDVINTMKHTEYWLWVEGIWFQSKDGAKSSHKIIKTAKRARAIAAAMKKQHPEKEVILTKIVFKGDKRYGIDFYIRG